MSPSHDTAASSYCRYTLREKGDTFGTSLYGLNELGYTRAQYNATVDNALGHGVASVTPWIALGSGHEQVCASPRHLR